MESELDKNITELFKHKDEKEQNLISGLPVGTTKFLENKYDKPDPTVSTNNSWLFRCLIGVNVGLLLLVLTFVVTKKIDDRMYNDNMHLKEVLIFNAVIFLCVGIIEYWFFTNIVTKYIPVKPSFIIDTFLQDIEALF